MAWAVGNPCVGQKASAFPIMKQASGTAKVDPLTAFDAIALMSTNPWSV